MESLFEAIQKDKTENYKFHAAIHGIDLDKNSSKGNNSTQSDPSVPLFGDPESYQSLSDEEREAETKKMMSKHRAWSGNSFKKG